MFEEENGQFNWKMFISILGASCLGAGIVFGVIIYYVTKPNIGLPSNPSDTQGSVIADKKIKGNKNSRIYHLPHCPNYNDIAEKNIIWFKTNEDAEKAGFRMARNC